MRNRLIVFFILSFALLFGVLFARQMLISSHLPREPYEDHKVRLLTYPSFVGASGPGSVILKRFEKEHHVKFEVVSSQDAGLLLQRLKLAAVSAPFDIVLGLDQMLIEQARRDFQWAPLEFQKEDLEDVPARWSDTHFLAYDWSPLTFVYRKDDSAKPTSLNEMLNPEYAKAFALQDPHSSSPGLQFLNWVKALKKDEATQWLEKFRPNINSVSPSWSFSYGLFEKKQAQFVFSYLTSLAFHWQQPDGKAQFQVLQFPEGHPAQIEFVAIPANCRECALATEFVRTLQSEWAQKLIMEKNFMFPVRRGVMRGTVFEQLPQLKVINTETDKDLHEWEQVFPH